MVDDMSDLDERWEMVGDLIEDALALLPESFTAVSKRLGVSPTKFRELREGKPGNYRPDTLVKVSQGLWGEPTVIARILDGEEPRLIAAISHQLKEGDWVWAISALDSIVETVYETHTEVIEGEDPPPRDVFEQLLRGLETTLQSAIDVYEKIYRTKPPKMNVPFSWRTFSELRVGEAVLGLQAALAKYDAAIAGGQSDDSVRDLLQDVILWQGRVTAFEREDLTRDARVAAIARRQREEGGEALGFDDRTEAERQPPRFDPMLDDARLNLDDAQVAQIAKAADSGDANRGGDTGPARARPGRAVGDYDPDGAGAN